MSYQDFMNNEVVPYLNERRENFYLNDLFVSAFTCTKVNLFGTVVISHGYTENIEKYRENIYRILQAGFNVVMHEHHGHGRSYRLVNDPTFTLVHTDMFERYVVELAMVAREAKLRFPGTRLFLYSHSMGGGIGAAALAMYPNLFAKAVLSSPMIRPLTGSLPFFAAKLIAAVECALGFSRRRVPGQIIYESKFIFERSSATSRERFDYEEDIRFNELLFHNSRPSYGWVHEAARLNSFLMTKAPEKIVTPFMLFQADNDHLVDVKEQNRFVGKVLAAGRIKPVFIKVKGTKHEIFNSDDLTVKRYWKKIFDFYRG